MGKIRVTSCQEVPESNKKMGRLYLSAVICVVFAIVAVTVDSKTVLYGTQGLHDKTCPEIASDMRLDCPLATPEKVSAARCRLECKENSHPCYHLEDRECFCCKWN